MVASGVFQVELSGGDEATGVTYNPLESSIKNMRKARCIDGAPRIRPNWHAIR